MSKKLPSNFILKVAGNYFWHSVYFLISILGIAVIAISIFVTQENRKQFQELLESKAAIRDIRIRINELNKSLVHLEDIVHLLGSYKIEKKQFDRISQISTDFENNTSLLREEVRRFSEKTSLTKEKKEYLLLSLQEITQFSQDLRKQNESLASREIDYPKFLDQKQHRIALLFAGFKDELIKIEFENFLSFKNRHAAIVKLEKFLGLFLIVSLLLVAAFGLLKSLKLESQAASDRNQSSNLLVSNQRLEYVLDGAKLGAWDWWIKTNKVSFDNRWLEMLGFSSDEGSQSLDFWAELVHPDDLPGCYKMIKFHLEGKTPVYESIHRMRHKSGKWIWILDRGKVSERDLNGNPLRLTGTHFDITDFKERELLSLEIEKIAKIGGWEMDLSDHSIRWSDQIYKIYGLPVGSPIDFEVATKFQSTESRTQMHFLVKECIAGKSTRIEFEFTDSLGAKKWVESVGIPIIDSNKKVHKIRGTFRDITAQKVVEHEIEMERERYRRLVLNSPGMVYEFKLEPNGRMYFPYVSPKAFEIYELEKEDFDRNPEIMLELAEPDRKEALHAAITESAKNLTPFHWRGQIQTKSGKRKHIIARSIPTKQTDGSILWDGIIIDISIQVATEKALEEEKIKALHASKLASLGEVSAGIAHEINNPLTVVAGTLPLLKKYLADEEKFDAKIESMKKGCDRISKIVQGLKKFSRSNPSKELKVQSLKNLLDEVHILTQAKVNDHSIAIEYLLDPNLKLLCDELEIEQVFINLINNACDAIKDLPEKWIRVEAKQVGEEIVVRVFDSGNGIPAEIKDRLFQPFFTTKAIGKGTGLGLSISKGILDSHKADFFVNSEFANTCFEIRFPSSVPA